MTKFKRLFVFFTTSVLCSFFVLGTASAIDEPNEVPATETAEVQEEDVPTLYVEDDGMTHIGVSPYDQHLELNAGDHYEGSMKLLNSGAGDIEWTLNAVPYQVNGADYLPDFVSESSMTQISKWVSFPATSGVLKSGRVTEVKYTIDVPEDVQAGGQYTAITATAKAINEGEKSDAGFSLTMSVSAAMIVYANIGGETRIDYEFTKNEITPILLSGPVTGITSVKNSGNTHLDASFQLEVYPLFSQEEYYSNYDEDSEFADTRVVMPGSERQTILTWDGTPELGIYRVVQRIIIGEDISEKEQIVVKCPVWLLAIVVFVIISFVIYVVTKAKKRRTYGTR